MKIVFFSSCNSVNIHAELLNNIDIPVLDLHTCVACRVSRSSKSTLRPFPNSVTPIVAFPLHEFRCPWPRYPRSRLDNPVMTRLMILETIFTELAALLDLGTRGRVYYLGSCDIWLTLECH